MHLQSRSCALWGNSAALSSAVAGDFVFVRIFGTHSERDSTARGELRGHYCFARRACFHKIVQNAVRYRFVKRALIPIRSQIKLEGFAFDAKAVRDVIDVDPGKIGLAGDRANRSEIVRLEMNPVIPTGRIWKGFESRLSRGGGQSPFTSSEKGQSTCAFCFCHSDIKVRPKAIEVNRPYLAGKRAGRSLRVRFKFEELANLIGAVWFIIGFA
jgi:hypothetical protein